MKHTPDIIHEELVDHDDFAGVSSCSMSASDFYSGTHWSEIPPSVSVMLDASIQHELFQADKAKRKNTFLSPQPINEYRVGDYVKVNDKMSGSDFIGEVVGAYPNGSQLLVQPKSGTKLTSAMWIKMFVAYGESKIYTVLGKA